MNQREDPLPISPEEIQNITRILTKTISENPQIIQEITTVVIPEEQITHVINLDAIASSIHGITDILGQISGWFRDVLSSVATWIVSSVNTFVASVRDRIRSDLASLWYDIQSTFTKTLVQINNYLNAVASSIITTLRIIISSATHGLSDEISDVMMTISGIGNFLRWIIPDLQSRIFGTYSIIEKHLSSLISSISSISSLVEKIPSMIISSITGFMNRLTTAFEGLSKALDPLFRFLDVVRERFFGYFDQIFKSFDRIFERIDRGLRDLDRIFADLSKSFERIGVSVGIGFERISTAFMGFTNSILGLPELLASRFSKMGEWIWTGLPKEVAFGFESFCRFLPSAIKRLTEGVEVGWTAAASPQMILGFKLILPKYELPAFWSTPSSLFAPLINALVGIYEAYIKPALTSIAEILWSGLKSIADFFISTLKNAWEWLKSAFEGFINFLKEKISSLLKGIFEIFAGPDKILEDVFKSIFSGLPSMIGEYAREMLTPFVEKRVKEFGLGTPQYLRVEIIGIQILESFRWAAMLLSFPLWASIPIRLLAHTMYQAGQAIYEIKGPIEINLAPFGIGLKIPLSVLKALGASLSHFSKEIKGWIDTLSNSLIYGMGIWVTQPITRLLNITLRNIIPIELPTLDFIVEATRRSMPTKQSEEILLVSKLFLALYGYSDLVLDFLFAPPEKFSLEIEDRFKQKRRIPLSLIYELPSASDVIRMVIRDIFGVGGTAIRSFLDFCKARGMPEDVGALYFMLHYRYPPPERLWSFTMRGISRMLWATQPHYVFETVKQELEYLKAPIPTDAKYWNVDTPQKAAALLSAFNFYMSWHDYFMGTWLTKEIINAPENFTSDNQIVIDTLADIPSKIDQRWMIKWGLYEHLKKYGVTIDSEIKDFLKIINSAKIEGAIELNLSNFCRTLQATGLHPYWVPITAIAEAMNVLTEERTLLRSGAQALFKEGFLTIDRFEKILTDAIMVSYHVAYFDMDMLQWKTGYVNMPIMFLPAERELIKYRALMDRASDILREIQRDISNAYQDGIIASKQEYIDTLNKIIEDVNKTLPEPLKLNLAKEYYDVYVDALDIYRDVYLVRRIRSWSMRWLGWIMYRVATGLVTDEELNKLVEALVKYSRLSDTERQFFIDVFQAMRGIAMREYAPSPSQLATLAEYIPIPDELIRKSFEIKMITPEWQEIWGRYIKIRPLVDDIKALINTYRRAILYVKIPPEIEQQILHLAHEIGYTERELAILGLRIQLEELIMASKEFFPSPSTLATLAEYVALPEELIKKALEAKHIPPEWQSLWLTYIRTKPIKSDIKSLLSTYIRAMRYKAVTKDEVEAFIKTLPQYGFSQNEINFITKRIQLEEAIAMATATDESYIPTLTTLATFSEYMMIPDDVIKAVFEARGIPTEWQNFWLRYIKVKPLADDVRGLLSTYRRAALYVTIPEDVKKKIEEYANLIGFTQVEWDILNLRIQLEEMILNSKEYIPTPSTLASLVEYVPEAREFFKDVMIARRVPERWQAIWAKYMDIRPLVDDIKRYLSRAEALYVRFMIKKPDFEKILTEVADFLGYTKKETEFLMKITDFERYRNAWTELIGTVDRLVTLSEYSPRASKFAIAKVYEMIDALPLPPTDKQELKLMWEEYIRNRPVKSEAKLYITQLINAYVEGLLTQLDFYRELENMKKWGFSDAEIEFYKMQAEVRKARKLKIPLIYGE